MTKLQKGVNDLETRCKQNHREDLLEEWGDKNEIKPDEVTPFSGKKVVWVCKKGHEWEAIIANRTGKNTGCPFCAGQKVIPGINDLETWCKQNERKEILKEWSDKNTIRPNEISAHSSQKVIWCCEKGHEWTTPIVDRTAGRHNCPYCAGRKVKSGENDFETWCNKNNKQYLLKEWSDKNTIKPNEITRGSNQKIIWCCEKGHEWQSSLYNRLHHSGCPVCKGKKILSGYNDLGTYCLQHGLLDIYKEYDQIKNSCSINKWFPKTDKKVWWKCPQGHSYRAAIRNRIIGKTKCPYCMNKKLLKGFNDLKTLFPEIADEFDIIKNKNTPENFLANSKEKVWWKCKKCGSSFLAEINRRTYKGINCSVCANRRVEQGFNDLETRCKQNNREEILREWDKEKNTILPSQVLFGTTQKFYFICPTCHRSYYQKLRNKTLKAHTCPYCTQRKSNIELTLYESIKKYVDPFTQSGKKFFKKEIDIYSPELNLYLEYDGVYYHNNDEELYQREIEKNNCFKENKIKLIRIKETKNKNKNLKKESSKYLDVYFIFNSFNKDYWNSLSVILEQLCFVKIDPKELQNTYFKLKTQKIS